MTDPFTDTVSVRREPKPPTPSKLFHARMIREGRDKEYHAKLKAVMEQGINYGTASWRVKMEMGYAGPAGEKKLAAEHAQTLHLSSAQVAQAKEKVVVQQQRALSAFERAVAGLPNTATRDSEIEWLRAHAAMTRMNLSPDGKRVFITIDDLLHAAHGPCPSKAAATQLAHWVNQPDKFFEMILSVDKKRGESDPEDEGVVKDLGIADVERLIREIEV